MSLGDVISAFHFAMSAKQARREDIATFLDSAAKHAEDLAHVWQSYAQGNEIGGHRLGIFLGFDNSMEFGAVETFYMQLSNVLADEGDQELKDRLIDTLATMIVVRFQVKRLAAARGLHSPEWLEDGAAHWTAAHTLQDAVGNLAREAGRFRALAEAYKAKR